MGIRRLAAVVAALALAGLGPTPSFGALVTYTVDRYDTTFSVTGGTAFVHLNGTSAATDVTLTPGVPQTITLDTGFTFGGFGVPTSGQTFTGTATSNITLNEVTLSISDAFTLTFSPSATPSLSFSGGAPDVFNLGAFQVTVTPIASSNRRQATFLETPPAAVPELSSALVAGFGALAGLGVWARRRWAAR
jgi:hypothetical protein